MFLKNFFFIFFGSLLFKIFGFSIFFILFLLMPKIAPFLAHHCLIFLLFNLFTCFIYCPHLLPPLLESFSLAACQIYYSTLRSKDQESKPNRSPFITKNQLTLKVFDLPRRCQLPWGKTKVTSTPKTHTIQLMPEIM